MSLASYMWPAMRVPTIISWTTLFLISLSLYLTFLSYIKLRSLEDSLIVASDTIAEAVEIADWNFVLSTLKANTASSNTFQLSLTSSDGKLSYAGPFGNAPFGTGSVCREVQSSKGLKLSGCTKILNQADYGSIVLFSFISGLFTFLSFGILRARALALFAQISEFLTGDPENTSQIVEIDSIKSKLSALIVEKEALSKEKALAELATQVAHDIRSPLTALRIAAAGLADLSDERQVLITQAAQRIEGIANQLLQQHRSKRALRKMDRRPIDASGTIRQIVAEKRLLLEGCTQIKVTFASAAGQTQIFADETEFAAVISNLINNSLEAIGQSGEVKISCSVTNGRNFELEIQDSGHGFPTEVLRHFGERGLTVGKKSGSGLGLSNAKQCIAGWGGRLQIANRDQGGALVHLSLPLVNDKEVQPCI